MLAKSRFHKHLIRRCAVAVLAFIVAIQGQAQTTNGEENPEPTSAGPEMWQVSKGHNTLWIFGMLTPLRQDINWQSQQVASVIARSQEYIYIKTPEIEIPINPLKIINGLRLVHKLRYNPNGKTLADVIPPDLYARFSRLLTKYPLDDMENVRPYFAADGIRGMAVLNSMLTEDHGVDIEIENLVNKNESIKRTPIYLGPESINYEFLKESADKLANGTSLTDEIHCLEVSVASIENDIPGMQARARAWESGDMEGLYKNRDYQKILDLCRDIYFNIDDVEGSVEKSWQNWMHAAEQALGNNESTFAVLDIDRLLDADGLLERLRSKGYSIIEP
jgi:hypothetical protein